MHGLDQVALDGTDFSLGRKGRHDLQRVLGGAAILKSLGALPAIVTVDAVSISPTGIKFGPRIALEPAEENVEASDLAPLIED